MIGISPHQEGNHLTGNNNSSFFKSRYKTKILGTFLQDYSIISDSRIVKSLSNSEYSKIALRSKIPQHIVKKYIERFLKEARFFNKFLVNCKLKWQYDIKKLNRKVRIILFKIYRIAPVFDYKRARTNLKILQEALAQKLFWPQISTQIAIVIYITDKKKQKESNRKKILQKNIRTLCNCSAYAFHRTRNIMGIK